MDEVVTVLICWYEQGLWMKYNLCKFVGMRELVG